MDFERFIRAEFGQREDDWIADLRRLPARQARYAEPLQPLPGELDAALGNLGINRLYAHQVEALEAARDGRDIVISTMTASGKSLAYNLPVLERLLSGRGTALYVFPTKALARDQAETLRHMDAPGIVAGAYDGDTPREERAALRRTANLIITNPDMLHLGILGNRRAWSGFLSRLTFIVIDEAHTLRGVFGSNAADLFRRLDRICRRGGATPQYILTSATIRNPVEHASRLIGRPVELISADASPAGERTFAFINPPISNAVTGKRQSGNGVSAGLFAGLVEEGVKTILFGKSKKAVEIMLNYARENLHRDGVDDGSVASYRAGYLAEERREVERALREDELLGVATTNALELGVDIGGLDASIMNGFPGSVASTWQQAGRAGRATDASLSVLIAGEDMLDQYWMNDPDDFFGRPSEEAVTDPERPAILSAHLQCAAHEWPLEESEAEAFGPSARRLLDELVEAGKLRRRGGRWQWAGLGQPHPEVNIRASVADDFAIVECGTGTMIGTLEASLAHSHLHREAVYMHAGRTYVVEELDLEHRVARVSEGEVDYFTQAKREQLVTVMETLAESSLGSVPLFFGRLKVTSRVTGFQKRRIKGGEVISLEPLELPSQTLETEGLWFGLPDGLVPEDWLLEQILGSLHAVEHCVIGIFPAITLCDRWDIGGLSTDYHEATDLSTVFIYDAYPGGIGIAEAAYRRLAELLAMARLTIASCPCKTGCPSCIQSPKCGNLNEPLDKAGALELLEKMLGSRSGGR